MNNSKMHVLGPAWRSQQQEKLIKRCGVQDVPLASSGPKFH